MKTTPDLIEGLTNLKGMFKHARDSVYEIAGPAMIMIPNLKSLDNILKILDAVEYDLRKQGAVEREVLEYDRVLKIATGQKGAVGRDPDGRDYNELFTILSIVPPKEKA